MHGTRTPPPSTSQPSAENLRGILDRRRLEALVADAEFICNRPDGDEKIEEAKRHIREAMVQRALGRISQEERDRILDILSFAVTIELLPDDDAQPRRSFKDPLPYDPIA